MLKEQGPNKAGKKIKIYYYCHTASVIDWFAVLERFSMKCSGD